MSLLPSDPRFQNQLQMQTYQPTGQTPSHPSVRSSANPNPANNLDLVGPILRRKFLIALLMIIGGITGYILCQNTPAEYQSVASLMITSQAPTVIDGNMTSVPKVSIPRHHRLLTSQLVLGTAIEKGDLAEMKTFADSDDVMSALLENILQVEYSKKETDDTLEVSAIGNVPEELPVILRSILDSYEAVIKKQSTTSGDENVALISQLNSKLEAEKQAATDEYLALLAKLNLPDLEKNGIPTNPYVDDLKQFRLDRNELVAEIREVAGRLLTAEQAIAAEDPNQINYLSTEAKKFLGVEIDTVETLEEDRKNNNYTHIVAQQSSQVFALERQLNDLLVRKAAFARTLGKNHPTMKMTEDSIESTKEQLQFAREQFEKAADNTFVADETEEEMVADLAKRNRQWISIYHETLKAEKQRLDSRLAQVDEDLVDIENKAKAISTDIMKVQLLKTRIAEKQANIDEVLSRLSEVNVVASNFNDTKVERINMPSEAMQIGPSTLKFLAIGFMGGGLLGAALALLVDMADQTFRNPGEIFEKLGVPVIAKLPPIRMPKKVPGGMSPALISLHNPTASAAEAIRAARTAMFFTAQTEDAKVFLFTSPSPGDGKTTTTSNLAISIAQAGKSVVLVDADFRRPRVHNYFGEKIEPGLIQALAGTLELSECLQPFEQQENLTLLPAGGRPKNPGEIVTSKDFGDLINTLRDRFDFVLIDSPPVLPVSDAAVISAHADGAFMIMRIRKGVAVTATKAKEKLEMVQARLFGVIVNGVDDNPHYNEYGSYGYGYGYNYPSGNGKYYESRNSRYQEKIGHTP